MIRTPKGEPLPLVAVVMELVGRMNDGEIEDLISRLDDAYCLNCGWKRPVDTNAWKRVCHCTNDE